MKYSRAISASEKIALFVHCGRKFLPGIFLARNPKFLALDHKTMHVCCAESSVDRDCVLVPEILLTVQGGRRFLSRRGAKERWQCLRQ